MYVTQIMRYFILVRNSVRENVLRVHGKNNFAEKSKILLDTDMKTILLIHQDNFEILKIMSNSAKNFDILATRV